MAGLEQLGQSFTEILLRVGGFAAVVLTAWTAFKVLIAGGGAERALRSGHRHPPHRGHRPGRAGQPRGHLGALRHAGGLDLQRRAGGGADRRGAARRLAGSGGPRVRLPLAPRLRRAGGAGAAPGRALGAHPGPLGAGGGLLALRPARPPPAPAGPAPPPRPAGPASARGGGSPPAPVSSSLGSPWPPRPGGRSGRSPRSSRRATCWGCGWPRWRSRRAPCPPGWPSCCSWPRRPCTLALAVVLAALWPVYGPLVRGFVRSPAVGGDGGRGPGHRSSDKRTRRWP